MNVLDTSKNITRKSCISNAVSLNTRPFRSRRESKHDKVEIGQNNILDELFESSFPPVRSFDGEKRSYESRYPNSKRSLLPFELTPRVLCCIDNIKMGVKTGAIVGSIFGGINGTYHAIKYRNYMSIPVFAIGGAISFGFFLGCGMIVRCQPTEVPRRSFSHKYNQVIS
ncbi:hypothetical protein OJ252_1662 [Cryptosporidium canis]|uniref:Reactive oxygen species modulator 1 n=1 Tax=Cryptosporidium canis TaxID=195482 RepID=A0ABQ8P8G0_9CRYT|nr:hypothetical protein OJ252_1662 [Cryptosporidium canis]